MLSAVRPEAPSAFAAAVHDCAGVHGAHQHPRGPSATSRTAAGTVEKEGSGQPCPLVQHPSWQYADTSLASSSGLQDASPRAHCSQHHHHHCWPGAGTPHHVHPAQPTGTVTAPCPGPQALLPPPGHPLVLCCPRGTACCSSLQPTHTNFIPAQLVAPGCHKHP